MGYRIASVSLEEIDDTDKRFKISTRVDKADLTSAISAVGLLSPPVLMAGEKGYTIVSGFRRIQTIKALGWAELPARILPADFSVMACARIAVADNSFQRSLNIVEQSRAYALIQRYSDSSSDDWQDVARMLGLPDSETAMRRLISVDNLTEPLQHAILEGSIALPVAFQVNMLQDVEREPITAFFRRINTNLNLQRELLELIREIAIRNDVSLQNTIERPDVLAVMQAPHLSAPQKVQRLRRLLRTIRYPALSRAEDRYHALVKALKLDPRIQLQPPPEFEGKIFRLSVTIENRRQLKALQSEIDRICSAEGLLPE